MKFFRRERRPNLLFRAVRCQVFRRPPSDYHVKHIEVDFFTARRACHLLLAAVFTAVAALVRSMARGEDPKVATIKAAISAGTSTADQRPMTANTLGIPAPGADGAVQVVAPGAGRVA